MNIKIIRTIFLSMLLLSFAVKEVIAEDDLSFWISTDFEKELSDNFKISVEPEIRLKDNFEFNKFLTDFSVSYKPIKYFQAKIGYRLVLNDGEIQNRFFANVMGSKKVNRFKGKIRLKYTNDSEFSSTSDSENYLRYKADISYNVSKSKLTPFVSAELFHSLNDKEFDAVRYQIGADYKLNKHNQISFAYSLDDIFQKTKSSHILKLKYCFDF